MLGSPEGCTWKCFLPCSFFPLTGLLRQGTWDGLSQKVTSEVLIWFASLPRLRSLDPHRVHVPEKFYGNQSKGSKDVKVLSPELLSVIVCSRRNISEAIKDLEMGRRPWIMGLDLIPILRSSVMKGARSESWQQRKGKPHTQEKLTDVNSTRWA